MRTVMNNFSTVPNVRAPRAQFDRSHGVKTTFNSGDLIPIYVDEVLPGDTFHCRTSGFCRMATPLHPLMDNMYMDTFYFFVPNRLIWDNWQKMMGEQDNPGDSTDYITPKLDLSAGAAEGSLLDYMGIPTNVSNLQVNALHTRAYNLIYNQWFRDQNLQDSVVVDKDDGLDDPTDYTILKRGKRHDYFTSSLPWPQKNNAGAVDLPLGDSAPVLGLGKTTQVYPDSNITAYETDATTSRTYLSGSGTDGNSWHVEEDPDNLGFPNLRADLSQATAATINQLRQAFQIQSMYETDARGGTRYIEIIKAHFGVTSPDARLQRPEYLGGGSAPVQMNPVSSTNNSPSARLGTQGAYSTTAFTGHGFSKSFVEHGVVIGLASVRADLTYQQGINRMWFRDDRLDYYWPALSVIGEQTVLNKEIFTQGTSADDDVFGYQERFAEYRYKPSTIHGEFRSNSALSLDVWHLSQDFADLPTLGDTFIKENIPIDRVRRETAGNEFICDFHHQLMCARALPMYGIPGSLMRF